jgi:hypothetical protein
VNAATAMDLPMAGTSIIRLRRRAQAASAREGFQLVADDVGRAFRPADEDFA